MSKFNCVLLVDDDQDACFLNKRIIDSANFASHTHVVNDGHNALDFVSTNCLKDDSGKEVCPELIFLDINMPLMDGFEFLDEFKNLPFNSVKPKIVMLTSSGNEEDIRKAKEFNVAGYLKASYKNKVRSDPDGSLMSKRL